MEVDGEKLFKKKKVFPGTTHYFSVTPERFLCLLFLESRVQTKIKIVQGTIIVKYLYSTYSP